MKRKNLILTLLIALSLVLFIALNASAEYQRYICTVTKAGPAGESDTWLELTDTSSPPAFEVKGFLCPEERAKEMLAVALTAMSNNLKVEVIIDPEVEYGYVYAIFLYSE